MIMLQHCMAALPKYVSHLEVQQRSDFSLRVRLTLQILTWHRKEMLLLRRNGLGPPSASAMQGRHIGTYLVVVRITVLVDVRFK